MKVFRPRSSYGWAWLTLMAAIIIAVVIAPAMAMEMSSSSVILTVIVCSLEALGFLVLAFCEVESIFAITPGWMKCVRSNRDDHGHAEWNLIHISCIGYAGLPSTFPCVPRGI